MRLAFSTMPLKHPIMLEMVGNLGRLGADEIKRILGVPPNYDLPATFLAQVFGGGDNIGEFWTERADPRDFKRGTGQAINFGRMNPFGNALVNMQQATQIPGTVSPLMQMLTDQAFKMDTFSQREWTKGGLSNAPGEKVDFGSVLGLLSPNALVGKGLHYRQKVFLRQSLGMLTPYQLIRETGLHAGPVQWDALHGPQSTESLPWAPVPMKFTEPEIKKSVKKSTKREESFGVGNYALGELAPLFRPVPTPAAQILKRDREMREIRREREKRKGRPKRRKSSSGAWGGSSGGSWSGGSGSSW
jgi:hypothetical protein